MFADVTIIVKVVSSYRVKIAGAYVSHYKKCLFSLLKL